MRHTSSHSPRNNKARNDSSGNKNPAYLFFAFVNGILLGAQFVFAYYSTSSFLDYTNDVMGGEKEGEHYTKKKRIKIPLHELTRNDTEIECEPPLRRVNDRIVEPLPGDVEQAIPRNIHVSWKNRCLATDIYEMTELWKKNFPSYSFYFHDDEAVERLLQQEWPEFPHVHLLMNGCLKVGGAIKVDIWRLLVLWEYGGIYSDCDNGPGRKFTQDVIGVNDTAFFLSDEWNRPSQWIQIMEPKHPIAYYTIWEAMRRIQEMEEIDQIKPVFTTGPDALKHGYGIALRWGKRPPQPQIDIYATGVYPAVFGKNARKLAFEGKSSVGPYTDYVEKASTNEKVPYDNRMITKKQRIKMQTKSSHWTEVVAQLRSESEKENRSDISTGHCLDNMFMHHMNFSSVFL